MSALGNPHLQFRSVHIDGMQRPAITKHLNNIFNTGELDRESTCSILEHMGNDGKQRYQTNHCGHSLKDMGQKRSAISLMGTPAQDIIDQVK